MPPAAKRTFRTAREIAAIKAPSAGREEYWDETVKGLGLRVSAPTRGASSGRKSWVLLYRVQGDKRLRRATFGTYPVLSLAEARKRAIDDLRRALLGKDPAAERKAQRQANTFGELAELYMQEYAKKKKRSWFKDRQALDRDLLPRFKSRKAASITRRDIKGLLQEITDRGAPVGANRTLEIIRKIYNWAIDEEIVEINPCARIEKFGIERKRDRVLTDDEIRPVWMAFEQERPVTCAHFKMRLLTLQRGGEITHMRWADIDLPSAWWTIPGEFTKNGLSHRVPLSPPAMTLLKGLGAEGGTSEWVFPSRTKDAPLSVFWRATDNIRERSGVTFVPHDLRRTGASKMTGDLGISRLVVSRILNHVETGITATYDRHSYDREKRQAMDAWGQLLLAIIEGKQAASNVVSLTRDGVMS